MTKTALLLADEAAVDAGLPAVAVDEARRRIERDLHDGAQQRLISLGLALHGAVEVTPPELTELRARLGRLTGDLVEALEELRRITRGLPPRALAEDGLLAALDALVRMSPVPVELTLLVDQSLPQHVAIGAYYLVSEALTNAARYSQASAVRVEMVLRDRAVVLSVSDDGVGGADPSRGSGLRGLRDRVQALHGTLIVSSRPGEGTHLRATFPLAD